jgi:hypothetical protein
LRGGQAMGGQGWGGWTSERASLRPYAAPLLTDARLARAGAKAGGI